MGIVIELAANLFDAFIGVWFVLKFNKGKIKDSKLFFPIILLIFTVSTIFSYISSFSLLHSIIITIILISYSLTIKHTSLITKLIAPIIFELVLIIVNTSTIFFISNILKINVEHILSVGDYGRYLMISVCKFLMSTVLIIINRLFIVEEKFTLFDFILYCFSPVISVSVLWLFMKLGSIYDLSDFSYIIILITLALALINISTLILFKKAMKNSAAKYELELLESRSELEEERYRELGNVYSRLRVTRHDIREHLMYINCLMEEHKYDEVNKYISDKQSELEKTKRFYHTGNRMADFIIDSKVTQTENIKFEISGTLDSLEGIDELDLTSLLGNMLNNAIEGVQSSAEKRIEIVFRMQGEYQNITCKNTINGSVLSKNPDLKSSKKDTLNHGFGIKSIKNIVEKYNGMIEFYEDNGMFCVHCALPLQAPARNE